MASRIPAQSLIEDILETQAGRPAPSSLARAFGRAPLSSKDPRYRRAKAEISVAEDLARLPGEWSVLHSVPTARNGEDINHLVVGPAGVFTVDTPSHRGESVWVAGQNVMVTGHMHPHVRRAITHARTVAEAIAQSASPGLPVRPVVAVVQARKLTVRSKPRDVEVLRADRMRRWLLQQPRVLAVDDVRGVTAQLSDARCSRAVPARDVALRQRFDALDRQIRGAQQARRMWSVVAAVAVVGVLVLLGPHFAAGMLTAVSQLHNASS